MVTKTEGRRLVGVGGREGAIEDTAGECRHGDETARSGANLRQEEGEDCDARVLCHSLSHIDSRPGTDFLPIHLSQPDVMQRLLSLSTRFLCISSLFSV